ncbi:DUF6493 family protein [Streptomyces sp. Je 1-79]|uniref:DUF7824 domain-containing protein n=1 Tax=Streptomyces sp. Je 1-79 TaxID=2943847 RepID=UPI0021A31725|nr:DUF6493 family protein [Streptomyces sp. Je 1-79]MCT4353643.1 DUF6493 family protein [Streptomyces sp. Je 1-79]
MSGGFDQSALKARLTAAREGRGVNTLLTAVRAGRAEAVPGLLKGLDPVGRKEALAELKALRTEVRGWGWSRWNEQVPIQKALRVAGAGCHTGAAAAAAWIGGRDLVDWGRSTSHLVLDVLADRDPAWLGDVAQRLAERPAVAENEYHLVRELVGRSGCAVPTTDGYVLGWTDALTGRQLLDDLRADPHTPILVPRVLDMAETPDRLTWSVGPEAPTHWPTALATLAAEGVLDRASLVDGCVARLLRGGRPRDLRFPLALLQLLDPTAGERRGRTADWMGMAADAPSPVAAYAQEVLAGLADGGGLSVPELAEMSGQVLFRTEKKLVRAQLTLLTKELRKDPGAAAELLPVVAEAFGHADTGIQERALKLVGRYLPEVDEQVREELAGVAAVLSPTHRQAAEELFGAADLADDLPYEETLPPVPEPRRVAGPAATVAELVEDLVTVSKGRVDAPPEEFERALDGLVHHAHRHREELKAALAVAFADAWWAGEEGQAPDHFAHGTNGVAVVMAALLGRVRPSRIHDARVRERFPSSCVHGALDAVVDARLWEAAALIGTDRLPFLLAAPTWHTGAIEPSVLVERLRAYREAGVDPAPVDLAQALLRVRKADPSAAAAADAASALGTRAGERLADWLRADASLAPGLRFLARERDTKGGTARLADRIVLRFRERRTVREEFPPVFRWLGGTDTEAHERCYHWGGERRNWPGVVPDDRETLASWLLPVLAGGVEWDERGASWGMTALAEADGPPGAATHLALAFALGCRHPEDRLNAVDTLLVLAARDDLDPGRLGETLAGLVVDGTVKTNRLADAARTAAATGAYGTTWSVLAPLLPALLTAEKPARGLGELLAVAADCVERCGTSREVPGLDATAERRGSSQLVVQAARLRKALRAASPEPSTGAGQDTTQAVENDH